ncbi:hypothetical protein RHGRI_038882 [Rhododendron griersonianum]|uniref:Uncharacterized protein n=1 Tax=Rhododendron griersonianum TaxID=479676 RepID=A0AAV6HM32_9ERIC|nr:hypothetical protein RHGRI_038882 [Rhododendron griersonianum]
MCRNSNQMEPDMNSAEGLGNGSSLQSFHYKCGSLQLLDQVFLSRYYRYTCVCKKNMSKLSLPTPEK